MSKWPRRVIHSSSWTIPAAWFALLLTAPAFGAGRGSSGTRQSQEKEKEKEKEKAARKACLTGDYNTGVSILADLFVEHTTPVYVYNQGRCLEQNSRYKDAIARFEEYLRIGETSTLDPADQASARKHIEDCKVKVAEENKSQVVAPQPISQPIPQPVPRTDANPQIVEKPKAEPAPSKSGKGLVVGGIVTGSVGVAAVVAGVIFNLKANSMVDNMQGTVDAYTASKNSTQQSYKTAAWVGYGVGAACIATGAVLIAVGANRGSSTQTDVALVPTVGPGQAGVLLRGGF